MHQMLEQVEETRSKRTGVTIVRDRGGSTLEDRHDDAVFPKRRNHAPRECKAEERKNGLLPPRTFVPEKRMWESRQTHCGMHTLSQWVT